MAEIVLRYALVAGCLVAMTPAARSQTVNEDPVVRGVSPPNATEQPQPSGCVLLKNDHVLFGQARQLGELVIVQSGDRGEIRLGREQVACWADSLRDLYQYRIDHRRVSDVATHLRDAKWCLRYNLLDLAAGELRAIYALDADNPEAKQIQRQLDRLAASPPPPVTSKTSVTPVSHEEVPSTEETPTILTGVPLSQFARQIQPMLVNRCGNCHSHRAASATASNGICLRRPPEHVLRPNSPVRI